MARSAVVARELRLVCGRIERISVTIRPLTRGDELQTRITIRGRVDADHEPAFWKGGSLTVLSSAVGAVLGRSLPRASGCSA